MTAEHIMGLLRAKHAQECWIEVVYSVVEWVGQEAKDRGTTRE